MENRHAKRAPANWVGNHYLCFRPPPEIAVGGFAATAADLANAVLRSGERTAQPFLDDPRGGGFHRREGLGIGEWCMVLGEGDWGVGNFSLFTSSCFGAHAAGRVITLSCVP